jgi:ATP-dependent helicase HrpB
MRRNEARKRSMDCDAAAAILARCAVVHRVIVPPATLVRVNPRATLPVDAILPELLATLRQTPNLVLEAPPGAGKTTRVPPALLQIVTGEIVVLEPRRIAARLAARRVAQELGEPVGQTVGYQVRFEEVAGPRTRLRFVTEGVLTRRLLSDPELKNVDAVVLDEFHERHLDTDLAIALLKRLQKTRPELRILVMSATLDTVQVAEYLGGCPILRSEGRLYDLEITHLPYSPKPAEVQMAEAVERLLQQQSAGDILAFLPGAAEIRRAIRETQSPAGRYGLLLLPLYGELTPAEQDRAVTPAAQRKVIFATNVAESSITVEGVSAVIDSGLARQAACSPWTGFPVLEVRRISKASAQQRAGRAGRTGPGRVLRLYSAEDYRQRPDHDPPEIVRSDLAQLCLALRAMEVHDLEFLDPPPEAAWRNAEALLDRLRATGSNVSSLARYPLHPRLSRIVEAAKSRGVGEDGCRVAALLSSGARQEKTDLLAAIESRQDPRTEQQMEQIRRLARPHRQTKHDDDALLMSVLEGFPDRVARRRAGKEVLLSAGGTAEVAGDPPSYEFLLAADAEDRRDKPLPLIRITARIEPEWLIELFPDRVREHNGVEWNARGERVEAVSALLYDELVIQESRGAMPDPEAAAALLARKAQEAGIERFVDAAALSGFEARAAFAGYGEADVLRHFADLCRGLRSFQELRAAASQFVPMMERTLPRLEELAPARLRLPSGRQTVVHYETGKSPWIASRLQDFFGLQQTPRIGRDHVPVVIHLLAPNQRAVQTTTDLAGFWERLYPQVRRELMRRYPRHKWPERP